MYLLPYLQKQALKSHVLFLSVFTRHKLQSDAITQYKRCLQIFVSDKNRNKMLGSCADVSPRDIMFQARLGIRYSYYREVLSVCGDAK
jgi:hypothetical protein